MGAHELGRMGIEWSKVAKSYGSVREASWPPEGWIVAAICA